MTFLEPILIPGCLLLIGAGITYAVSKLNKIKTVSYLLKYGPIIKKAYDVIDPILDKNLSRWYGSDIDKAIGLTIEAVADGELTDKEVKKLSIIIAERWLPQKAADKVRHYSKSLYEVPQVLAAKQITEVVNGITSKSSGLDYARKLLSSFS
jgi:hypothetical protein